MCALPDSNILPGTRLSFLPGNTFQNRSVSSAAAVATVCPSADMAMYITLRGPQSVS